MYLNKSVDDLFAKLERKLQTLKITFDMNLTGGKDVIKVSSASEDILPLTKSLPSEEAQLPSVHPVIQA